MDGRGEGTRGAQETYIIRAPEDEEAETKESALGGFGVWPGFVDLNQGGNGPIRKEIGPKGRTNKENPGHFF